jgi:hypothetical protein
MNALQKILERAKSENIFVDIFRDSIEEAPLFCLIKGYSHELVQLLKIDNGGEYDGFALLFVDDITRIRWGGIERSSLEKLAQLKNETLVHEAEIDLASFPAALVSVQDRFGYVCLYAEERARNTAFIGQMEELLEETLVMREFGTISNLDRSFLALRTRDLTRLDFDSKYERDLLRLHSIRQKDLGNIFRE